jgi:septal ring factor EnvC (AmiA/AmiB activator)
MASTKKRNGGADVPSLTLEVLKGLRADLNQGLASVRAEIRETNERLDRLERRQTETEVRLATELVAVAQAVGELKTLLDTRLQLRDTVADHEQRLANVERKLGLAS